MASVIKIEFEGSLRRLPNNIQGTEDFSFAKLEARVRDLFKLPNSAQLKMTYKDQEEDVVTLSNDQELKDACVTQKLNPLRVQVIVLPHKMGEGDVPKTETAPAELPSAQEPESAEKPAVSETDVKELVDCYVPLLNPVCPPSQLPELVDVIVKRVTAQLSTGTAQANASVAPSAEASQSTPLDWLRNLPTPKANTSSELEKQDDTHGGAPAETTKQVAAPAETTNSEGVIQKGVTCDICHMSPITGIRFKSIKKINYDLCGRCFDKSGKADEYTRIEQPLSRPMWGPIPMRKVHLPPARAIGPTDSSSSPKLVFITPHGGRCKPMRSC